MHNSSTLQQMGLKLAPAARKAFHVAAIVALISNAPPTQAEDADSARAAKHSVELRFLGVDKDVPLAGLEVLVTQGHGMDEKKFGPFKTDKAGVTTVSLPDGFYSLHLKSEKELPYLPVEVVWNKRSRTTRPDLSLSIKDSKVEKWLDGKQRDEGYEAPAKAGDPPRVTYTLLPACELVLRAVDVETGKGIAGASFYTENAVGEYWAHAIENQNLGGKSVDKKDDVSDSNGDYRRLVSANANYKYGIEAAPPGYEPEKPNLEVDVEINYGTRRAEHVFKFRKKP